MPPRPPARRQPARRAPAHREGARRASAAKPGFELPIVGTKLARPSKESLAWYGGLGAMVVLEVIEWPLALAVAAGHAIATNSHNAELREFAEGTEAGA